MSKMDIPLRVSNPHWVEGNSLRKADKPTCFPKLLDLSMEFQKENEQEDQLFFSVKSDGLMHLIVFLNMACSDFSDSGGSWIEGDEVRLRKKCSEGSLKKHFGKVEEILSSLCCNQESKTVQEIKASFTIIVAVFGFVWTRSGKRRKYRAINKQNTQYAHVEKPNQPQVEFAKWQ